MMQSGDLWVVIPAFNEGTVIGNVISGVRAVYPNVVLVDDCSRDDIGVTALATNAVAQGAHSVKLMEASKTIAGHIFRWAEVTRRHMVLTLAERREVIEVEHGDIVHAIASGKAAEARLAFKSVK